LASHQTWERPVTDIKRYRLDTTALLGKLAEERLRIDWNATEAASSPQVK